MKLLWQFLLLTISFLAVFAWKSSPLADYTIQAIGALALLYLISSLVQKRLGFSYLQKNESLTIFILNSIIFLLIFSTGGFSSSFFFLLYFLIFGIAFVFEPLAVFIFAAGTCLIFLPEALKDEVFSNMVRLGSLMLISPLGYYFGREYKEREKEETQTQQIAQEIKKNTQDVITKEQNRLPKDEVNELKDVIHEAEKLEKYEKST